MFINGIGVDYQMAESDYTLRKLFGGSMEAEQIKKGVEEMRRIALSKVESWHEGKWTDQETVSAADVHLMLNAIAGDIEIAGVEE